MDVADEAAVVFAKPAVAGEVKTRLARDIGDRAATSLYRAFLRDTAACVERVVDRAGRILAHAGEADHPSFDPFREHDFVFIDQGQGDLGERMRRGFDRCFRAGAERVTALGADSPTLPPRTVARGFEALRSGDVDAAVGPSFDGGYYLLALDEPRFDLLEGIPWSTPEVLARTCRRAADRGLRCQLLAFWYDVDTFADLRRLRTHLIDCDPHIERTDGAETAEAVEKLVQRGVLESASD
ncbi:MAG: TIGR04282 family arsenosugar biosynthesis glycosyltransferase [Bradymonadaceae bacterium]